MPSCSGGESYSGAAADLQWRNCSHFCSLTIISLDHNPQAFEHVPPTPLRKNPLCSPRSCGLHPSHQRLLLHHSIQVRPWVRGVRGAPGGSSEFVPYLRGVGKAAVSPWQRAHVSLHVLSCSQARSDVSSLGGRRSSWRKRVIHSPLLPGCDALLVPEEGTRVPSVAQSLLRQGLLPRCRTAAVLHHPWFGAIPG